MYFQCDWNYLRYKIKDGIMFPIHKTAVPSGVKFQSQRYLIRAFIVQQQPFIQSLWMMLQADTPPRITVSHHALSISQFTTSQVSFHDRPGLCKIKWHRLVKTDIEQKMSSAGSLGVEFHLQCLKTLTFTLAAAPECCRRYLVSNISRVPLIPQCHKISNYRLFEL